MGNVWSHLLLDRLCSEVCAPLLPADEMPQQCYSSVGLAIVEKPWVDVLEYST